LGLRNSLVLGRTAATKWPKYVRCKLHVKKTMKKKAMILSRASGNGFINVGNIQKKKKFVLNQEVQIKKKSW